MLPVLYGFISCRPGQICCGRAFDFFLVSRRSVHRAGTRFNRRGIDSLGKVANFIETEQIIATRSAVTSLVQTRGSLPIFWSQPADIRYMPAVIVSPYADHASAFRRHFTEQTRHYGPIQAVNLVRARQMACRKHAIVVVAAAVYIMIAGLIGKTHSVDGLC